MHVHPVRCVGALSILGCHLVKDRNITDDEVDGEEPMLTVLIKPIFFFASLVRLR
jgi:hypothetical protein